MNVVRNLERRLERLLEGVAGRVFSGRIHPSELAGKLAREADFARFEHFTGPATANLFVIQVNPDDLSVETSKLEKMLAAEMTAYTAEEGLRLEGPVTVRIEPSARATSGHVNCHVEVVPGPPVVWATLSANGESLDIGRNRATIGRAPDADVVVPHDDISRRHALIYREHGQTWLRDLSSANGTYVDGVRIDS
ncbi:MAG TPA: FhaA domain-containing protein, partial [Acidimicrobiia bacterium]